MIGQQVGNYRVVRKLGEGGMGAVYEAEHPIIGRRVALKLLHREMCDNAELVERFFSEARVVNAIGHEHIVEVSDLGKTPEGLYYLTMELLDGETLVARMERERPLDIGFAVAITNTIADALGAAHAHGVVHRDLKPDNIFLARKGRQIEFVKVLDFGIAKLTAAGGKVSYRTRTGAAIGTPYYMSPEQCAGSKDVDHRSDIYSLGVLLFEMVTGRVPFEVEGLGLMFMKHMQEPPPPPRSLRPDLPEQLEAVILKALAKKPDERFQSMEELRAALEGAPLPAATSEPQRTIGWSGAATPAATAPPDDAARVTTFSRTAGQVLEDDQQAAEDAALPRRGAARWAVLGGGAVAAALVAALLVGKRAPEPATVAPKAASAVAAPAPPPPAAPAPAPATAKLAVRSDPNGADVFRGFETTPIGRTPFELTAPLGRVNLTFRKSGFDDRSKDVDVRGDAEVRAALDPATPATRVEPPRRRAPKATRPASAPRTTEPEPKSAKKKIKGFVDDL